MSLLAEDDDNHRADDPHIQRPKDDSQQDGSNDASDTTTILHQTQKPPVDEALEQQPLPEPQVPPAEAHVTQTELDTAQQRSEENNQHRRRSENAQSSADGDYTDGSASKTDDPDADAKRLFAEGKYIEAKNSWLTTLKSCTYALGHFTQDQDKGGENKVYDVEKYDDFVAMAKKVRLNLALVCLKLREFGEAVNYCEQVLSNDTWNEKATYRRSLGLYEQGKLLEARSKLLQNYHRNIENLPASMRDLLNRIERSIQRKNKIDKAMYAALKNEDNTLNRHRTQGSGGHAGKIQSRFFGLNLFWNLGCTMARGIAMAFKTHIDYLVQPVISLFKRT